MLIVKELKKTIRSVAFLMLAVIMAAFVYSQAALFFEQDQKIEQPQPGQDYGTKPVDDPVLIMPAALQSLYGEFCAGEYTAYPVGFYKSVRLGAQEQEEMAQILSELSGISKEELTNSSKTSGGTSGNNEIQIQGGTNQNIDANGSSIITMPETGNAARARVTPREGLAYETFKAAMERADRLIGGGSSYARETLIRFGQTPITYEEASEQYEMARTKDRFTGAYARLFSDYMGVCVSILPVFLAVVLCMKDRSSRMEQLVFSRRISSVRLIFTRYAAIVGAVMLPVILLAYVSSGSTWAMHAGESLDYLAPLTYSVGWLMPSVMISTAVGMLLTELTGTPVAVLVQGLWWFLDSFTSIGALTGPTSLFKLSPRHNSRGNALVFFENLDSLVRNRVLFAALALAAVGLTVWIYEQKRRGNLHGIQSFDKLKATLSRVLHRTNGAAV